MFIIIINEINWFYIGGRKIKFDMIKENIRSVGNGKIEFFGVARDFGGNGVGATFLGEFVSVEFVKRKILVRVAKINVTARNVFGGT